MKPKCFIGSFIFKCIRKRHNQSKSKARYDLNKFKTRKFGARKSLNQVTALQMKPFLRGHWFGTTTKISLLCSEHYCQKIVPEEICLKVE